MSLLPLNQSKKNQNFAELLDAQSRCDYFELAKSPLNCSAALLPHLAMSKNISIEGMLESEAREYIANADKIYGIKGTVQGALDALATIGLHTKEYPAQIVEYRDLKKYVYKQKHNGASKQNNTSKHNAGLSIYNFASCEYLKHNGASKQDGMSKHNSGLSLYNVVLCKWYQIAVIISVTASKRQIRVASRLLKDVIPTRCEIIGFVNKFKDLHDGASKQDGSRNHGIWRLN